MRTSPSRACFVLIGAALGCAQQDADVELKEISASLSAADVLSFDDASRWHGPGPLTTSTTHSEGRFSLATRPSYFSAYQSDAFELGGKPREILVDIQLPAARPNQGWAGAVQLSVDSASKNVSNAWVGQVDLGGLQTGTFNTLRFTVPSWIANPLSSGAPDLKIKLSLNVPGASSVYLLDNLRIRTELLLHYEFDQSADGKVIDSSGYERHGSLVGGASIADDGRSGAALGLNGVDGYVQVPDGVLDSVQAVTFTAWVNLDRIDAWSRIFDFGGSNGGFAYLTPSTGDGLLRYSVFSAFANEGIATGPALTAGAWKHVAVTNDGRDYRLYVDGVEASNALTIPVPPSSLVHSVQSWIGRSRFPDPFLAGRIDDFRIYDRVLTQKEVAALASPGSDYSNWRFDETNGNTVADSSELDRDGRVRGQSARVQGVIDRALRLRGDGSYVELPSGIVQSCTDLTLTSWIKLNSNQPWSRVFDFGVQDASRFMYLSPSGFGASGPELRFGLITPRGVHDVGFPYVMPLQEWTHVGVTLRDELATLYLNGRAVASLVGVVSNPSDLGETTGDYLGKSTFAADPSFDGTLDDTRLSCRAYADRELAQLAHLPPPARLPNQLPLTGDISNVHDPVIAQAGSNYYVYSTGPGVLIRSSTDLKSWSFVGSVFTQLPSWITDKFGALDSLWAPDLSYFGGTYHLYYAASTFGSNHSCIGHATKGDLRSTDPWVDRGPVLCSNDSGSVDDFNAIDPNVIVDAQGTPWLSFGSFWGGLQIVKLNSAGERADTTITGIAQRPDTAIEAPYIIYRAPYYYLFASFEFCCRGIDSTYYQAVGRSSSVTGPYLDRTGLDMRLGGGTPVVIGDSRWRGPGHNAVLKRNDQYLNAYHSYDALNNGVPTLRLSELVWNEGWPVNAEP